MKSRVFPHNPFLMTFSKIALIDGAILLASIGLAVWQSDWMWYFLASGVVLSIAVFVRLNQRCIQALSCPHCHQSIAFEAGQGFVCQKCKTIWELG